MIVIKSFIEKGSLKRFGVGDNYTHPDKERLKMLVDMGYLKDEPVEPSEAEKPQKAKASRKGKESK